MNPMANFIPTLKSEDPNISAEAMVEAIISDAIAFGGSKDSRDDDMTVVVATVRCMNSMGSAD